MWCEVRNWNFIFVNVIFFCIIYGCTKAQAEVTPADLKNPADMAECRGVVGGIMKRQLEELANCTKIVYYTDRRDRYNKLQCMIKCVGVAENFLTKEGLLDRTFMDTFFKRDIPEKFHQRAIPILKYCFDHNESKLKPSEEYCNSYKPFSKCLLDAFPKFCTLEKEDKKKKTR